MQLARVLQGSRQERAWKKQQRPIRVALQEKMMAAFLLQIRVLS